MLPKQKQTKALAFSSDKKQVKLLILFSFFIFFLIIFIYLSAFTQSKDVTFKYGQKTCVNQVTFFPDLYNNSNKDGLSAFSIASDSQIKILDLPIIAFKTCFIANSSPQVGAVSVDTSLFSGWLAKRTYNIVIPEHPDVDVASVMKPVSIKRPLVIGLSEADTTFSYDMTVNNKTTECAALDYSIYCDMSYFDLSHAKKYPVKITRSFNGQIVSTVLEGNIETISATSLVSSTITSGQVVYSNPKKIDLVFDKNIVDSKVSIERLDGDVSKSVTAVPSVVNKTVSLNLESSLQRSSSYRLTVNSVLADDGSTLEKPKVINFSVSGGPSVATVAPGAINLGLSGTITLQMDQAIDVNQNLNKYIKIDAASYSVSSNDNQIFINYSGVPMCTNIMATISSGLKSKYGISQEKSWSYNMRTTCHSVSTIGYSVEGRPILAYTFGSGATTILYTGSIHGNEMSTYYLMNEWINELEVNYYSIPSDKKIVVVPTINPDGNAANRRNNSNNVDLNRNFSTNDWQTDVFSPDNRLVPSGGGVAPMSEPESQAIAGLTMQLRPRLTMSFHGSAGYAIGNQYGDSADLAEAYSDLVGYANMTGVSGAFSYPITGTYDDWIREDCGLTSVLVELSSNYYSEFSRNKDALWAMAKS